LRVEDIMEMKVTREVEIVLEIKCSTSSRSEVISHVFEGVFRSSESEINPTYECRTERHKIGDRLHDIPRELPPG